MATEHVEAIFLDAVDGRVSLEGLRGCNGRETCAVKSSAG